MKGLTPLQKRFVDEYLKDLNATQAYLRAGYKIKPDGARRAAHRLLTKVDVLDAIQAGQKKISERVQATVDDVVKDLITVKNRCLSDENFNAVGACRALELLGKHLGMFVERRVNANLDLDGQPTGLEILRREFGIKDDGK